ncbi:double-strand break repair helicase AddA [Acidocella aquatica]|uniref:DNA 3'-5' helicase n=1 Tax=Acidocella aquatica TaxID=1922313 RepID=A0ABQ6A2K2_9PROT|nr:double-strand break repair helicase AddA [Acidocella aquatica]GLR65532.1 double-strand break repair helicase AddA [Acidocella aquatica]
MTVIEIANAQQREASDPKISAFVAASAGSGKTKLLTDRLLRLMLAGSAPDKILCLTYTKAAAAEMTIRLNKRLGDWVVMDKPDLEAALRALDVTVNHANLTLARKLFADVLDLPGGMRIETIHAFCQSLLRRFPLEAGLSPHFEVADEVEEGRRLREAREVVLAQAGHEGAVHALAAETDETTFAALTQKFAQGPGAVLHGREPGAIAGMQRAALGAGDESEEMLRAQAVVLPREEKLRAGLKLLAERGTPKLGQGWAHRALDWLAQPHAARAANWDDWLAVHFTGNGKGTQNKLHNFFGKGLAAQEAEIRDVINAECRRIEAAQEQINAARLAALNANLVQLVAPIVKDDAAQKQMAAHLSYADLVRHTEKLFEDPGATWILYKLDGGIEHLLLDEVQDTAPAQWEIAAKIADEFFAGAGAREGGRTIFAVGDAKQSIFSFQGADLESFTVYQAKFREKVKAAGQRWVDGKLSVSFRSAAPVLALVDAVFASGPARAGVCQGTEVLKHEVSRAGQAGWVELWPLSEAAPPAELPPWAVPEDYEGAESARGLLARQIVLEIKKRLDGGEILQSRGRAVRPGDFLILVRRRDALVSAITRECKARGVPVAGLDRMVLTEQLAVSDLLALCDALLLGDDDLAFAQYLVSPLGGLSDESLMALAMGRRGSLLAALYARHGERAEWAAAKAFFETLRGKVDFLSPFALLSEALGTLGGRSRILRRLGPEAAEPVDELLSEALKFTQSEPGALQIFVHQLRQAGAQIKREADAGGDVVRIMTVHGAKGLQAPLVILPDTTALPTGAQKESLFWLPVPGQPDMSVPIFCPRTALRSEAVASAAARAAAAQGEEYNRLLYVALTRAEDGLIICGAKGRNNVAEASWYELVRAGFARLPEVAQLGGRLVHACAQTARPDDKAAHKLTHEAALPAWAGAAPGWVASPPGAETTRPERLAPSRGVEDITRQALAASPLGAGVAQARAARAAAMARGQAVHALLQHLPELPPPARAAAAARFIASVPELAGGAAETYDSVLAILQNPALAALFGPGSRAEVPLAGVIGDVEIGGLVDRLAVTEQRVIIADYKTDRAPPDTAELIPPGYLRQLAAYRAILAQIYPRHAVVCLLIWTQSAVAMQVPDAMLDAHAPA